MHEARRYGDRIRYRVTDALSAYSAKTIASNIRSSGVGCQIDTYQGKFAIWADKKLKTNFPIRHKAVKSRPRGPTVTAGRHGEVPSAFAREYWHVQFNSSSDRESKITTHNSEQRAVEHAKSLMRRITEGDGVEVFKGIKRIGFYTIEEDGRTLSSGVLKGARPGMKAVAARDLRPGMVLVTPQTLRDTSREALGIKTANHPIPDIDMMEGFFTNMEGTSNKFWGYKFFGSKGITAFWGRIGVKMYSYQSKKFPTSSARLDWAKMMESQKLGKGYHEVRNPSNMYE